MNPYEVLGVKFGASEAECRRAFHRLCKLYHPDGGSGDVDKYDAVCKAYEMTKTYDVKQKQGLVHKTLFTYGFNPQ